MARRGLARATVALAAAAGVAACSADDAPTDPLGGSTPNGLSAGAQSYLRSALDFMEEVFLYRSRVTWTQVRAAALDSVPGAQTPRQTYPGIRTAIRRLNDRHSGFWPPESAPGLVDAPTNNPLYLASGQPMRSRLAYLYVPTFTGRNPVGRADSILTLVRQLDQGAPCGWILDLRNNPGGYWAAMIAGLNPLIGDGRFGGLVDADSARAFFYSNGASAGVVQDQPRDSVEYLRAGSSYRLRRPGAPVAILQGPLTASAGELIILAFRGPGKPAMRAFGNYTYGVTTVPSGTYLRPDSAFLNITAAVMFDGNRRVYGDSLAPDERIAAPAGSVTPGAEDATVQAAQAWLLARPECAATAADRPATADRSPLPAPGRAGWARLAAPPGAPSPVFGGDRALPAPGTSGRR
ncbi:S41 family peptidase [Roseisolibacter sp. H3M3-2]|uniref:S41 family peptidase n=1 Tax=Roseisolibacter sp. H3M3-2 TaxID=3031323 RepID=UPI0023DAFF32|nr:S41 family peptidase [Roseisolibacter sp. H3M3-2]MDF1504249.1 S41 family peptidase [Roseisolibacter sp. H3M3-2]